MAGIPRVCVLSFRSNKNLVARCMNYEFEQVISAIDRTDLLSFEQGASFLPRKRVINQLTRHVSPRFAHVSPSFTRLKLDRTYDLFVGIFQDVTDVLALGSIKNWRAKFAKAVCWIDEIWRAGVDTNAALCTEILSQFDAIVTGCSGSVTRLQEVTGKPCYYVPPAVDVLGFMPARLEAERTIDVYSIGRRPAGIHEQLVAMQGTRGTNYVYDAKAKGPMFVMDCFLHRNTIVSNLKNSSFFLVYPAKFDSLQQTHGQVEFGPRYFEGAAAGAVLIGQPPDSEAFRINFDWPDNVVPIPFEETDLEGKLGALAQEPERILRIRRENVRQCLRRHDWGHRWATLLQLSGLDPLPALSDRIDRLSEIADGL